MRVGVAFGNVGRTGTVAAAEDTRDRSQHFDLAVLSDPLPGTRTNERTGSPISYDATIS